MWVSASEMSAYDFASLPVPAVVRGAIGRSARPPRLPNPPVPPIRPAVGEHEVDPFRAVERAAAADRDDRVDAARRRERSSGLDHPIVGIAVEVVKAMRRDAAV